MQLYCAWAEPTSEAATSTTTAKRAIGDAVRLLRSGVRVNIIQGLHQYASVRKNARRTLRTRSVRSYSASSQGRTLLMLNTRLQTSKSVWCQDKFFSVSAHLPGSRHRRRPR